MTGDSFKRSKQRRIIMNQYRNHLLITTQFCLVLLLTMRIAAPTPAQTPATRTKDHSHQVTTSAAASSTPVTGSGMAGHLAKWAGIDGSNAFTLSDSNVAEDKFGKVGIGTKTPTSLLTVQAMVETT